MDENEKENTDLDLETDGEQSSEDSAGDKDTSNTNADAEQEKPEDQDQEEPDAGKEDKEQEESLDQKVNRLAKSIADKSMKTYQAKDAAQSRRIAELEAELTSRAFDRDTALYLKDETEELGEDEAAANKTARERVKAKVLEYQKNNATVTALLNRIGASNLEGVNALLKELDVENLDKGIAVLNTAHRDQRAMLDVHALLFSEDKAKIEKVKTLVKRFEKANDNEDYEMILEVIKAEIKGTANRQRKPDSGRNAGSGGLNFRNLSPEEKIARGLKEEMKNRR